MTDKIKSNIKLFLITGPGHHAQILINAISQALGEEFYYATYWPEFAVYKKNKEGTQDLVHKSLFWALLNKLLWAVAARFPHVFKKDNRHLDLSYALYDRYVRARYGNQPILWAWTQVSLHTLKKANAKGARLILEYPMIHALEWDNIMKSALGKEVYRHSHSYFSSGLIVKMQDEVNMADHVNVLSNYAKTTFLKHGYPKEKVHISHLYIDDQLFKGYSVKPYSSVLKILFVGRIEVLKGIKTLIKALKSIDFAYELHLAGKEYEELLTDLAGIEPHIIRHGTLSKQQLPELYAQCDLLVLPSLQESFGLVMLEALSCGLPVLASKNTGAPDVLVHKETGYLFEAQDMEELVGGLMFYYDALKVQKRDFSQQCRAAALSFANKERYVSQIKTILNENRESA